MMSCCCCWCFYARRDETRQLLYSKPTVWKISGSGRQVADRHACDQGGKAKGGISARTERLWSGCGLPAATGHILPMAHSWTSMSGCQVLREAQRAAGTLRSWYHLLAVDIKPPSVSREALHCYDLHNSQPSHKSSTRLQMTTQTMIDSFVLMRQYYSQETIQQIHILPINWNPKPVYLHGFSCTNMIQKCLFLK